MDDLQLGDVRHGDVSMEAEGEGQGEERGEEEEEALELLRQANADRHNLVGPTPLPRPPPPRRGKCLGLQQFSGDVKALLLF